MWYAIQTTEKDPNLCFVLCCIFIYLFFFFFLGWSDVALNPDMFTMKKYCQVINVHFMAVRENERACVRFGMDACYVCCQACIYAHIHPMLRIFDPNKTSLLQNGLGEMIPMVVVIICFDCTVPWHKYVDTHKSLPNKFPVHITTFGWKYVNSNKCLPRKRREKRSVGIICVHFYIIILRKLTL